MLEVVTYEGEIYYIQRSVEQAFYKAIEEKRFVQIQGEMVATRSIRKVRPIEQPPVTEGLNKEQRVLLQNKCASYKRAVGREATDMHIAHWTQMIHNGETFTQI
jgi:hypothetical protein